MNVACLDSAASCVTNTQIHRRFTCQLHARPSEVRVGTAERIQPLGFPPESFNWLPRDEMVASTMLASYWKGLYGLTFCAPFVHFLK